ncbi:hypothetical protein OIU76_023658 [Salix suchowensis]|nr:hypothetical protein OIU76_023658 [Salix suchowensis]
MVPDFLENIKQKKFVLVHGEGFGAWCWYKTIALLEEAGLVPIAIDLTGSGIDLADTNSITTLAEYSKPLTSYLENLPEDEQVILVGHSSGGACVSYALEHFPKKISKAIFLCATMVSDGQRPFDVFAEELGSAERFMQESQFLIYGNGKDKPATAFMFEKQQMKGLYFNQSPTKDVALAMVSMRPIPLGPIMEKLSLSPEKYGTGRRFFIQTLDDRALSPDVQEKLKIGCDFYGRQCEEGRNQHADLTCNILYGIPEPDSAAPALIAAAFIRITFLGSLGLTANN